MNDFPGTGPHFFENTDGAGTFALPVDVGDGSHSRMHVLQVVDFDGDGLPDVVTAGVGEIAWYRNLGGGVFTAPQLIQEPASLFALRGADLDGDGDPEIIVGGNSAGLERLTWFRHPGSNPVDPDSDDDGLTDFAEVTVHASDPTVSDTDGDGLSDGDEVNLHGSSPTLVDTDADGLNDFEEGVIHLTNPASPDTDMDGRTDLAEVSFGPHPVLLASAGRRVVLVDWDGDTDLDFVTSDNASDMSAWYENTLGDASLFATHDIAANAGFNMQIDVADMDGNGDLDLLRAYRSGSDAAFDWVPNLGGGTWGPPEPIHDAMDARAHQIGVAAIDGDADLDVVWMTDFADMTSHGWSENLGGGTSWSTHSLGFESEGTIEAVDLDGDATLEVLIASSVSFVLEVRSDVALGSPPTVSLGSSSEFHAAVAADLDGDLDLDVISSGDTIDGLSWYENTDGNGTLGPAQGISFGTEDRYVEAVDFDADGDVDLVTVSALQPVVGWYENQGDATFHPRQSIWSGGSNVLEVAVGDLDGDGDLDVISNAGVGGDAVWHEDARTDPLDADSDDDGLLDGFEFVNGFDPGQPGEQNEDPDADGLDNLGEQAAGTDPNDPDTDGDGLSDGFEVANGTDPNVPNGSPTVIPGLGAWGAGLLVAVFGVLGVLRVRRPRAAAPRQAPGRAGRPRGPSR